MKRRAPCPVCGRSILVVNGKLRSHGFSFGERDRCEGSYTAVGPGHPVTTNMAATPPIHFRVSAEQHEELTKAGAARGLSASGEAKRRLFPPRRARDNRKKVKRDR